MYACETGEFVNACTRGARRGHAPCPNTSSTSDKVSCSSAASCNACASEPDDNLAAVSSPPHLTANGTHERVKSRRPRVTSKRG
jgi:hypothetical protein